MLIAPVPALAKPPPDPHMPNIQTGYCAGGRGLKGLQVSAIYCDGVPYADGSHWRYVFFSTLTDMSGMNPELRSWYGLHCVIGDELVPSALAPPGSCDGAV